MCSFVATIGNVPELLIKLVAYDQDYLGGEGVGLAYTVRDTYFQNKYSPTKDLQLYKNAYNVLDVPNPKNVKDLFQDTIKFPVGYDLLMLHTRKVSIGEKNINQIQPFITKNKEGVIFTTTHKGSIHNYVNIAKKHRIPVGENDSKTLANAITLGKEKEFLAEINGNCAVTWHRSDKPNNLFCVCITDTLTIIPKLCYLQFNDCVIIANESNALNLLANSISSKFEGFVELYSVPKDKVFRIGLEDTETIDTIELHKEKIDNSRGLVVYQSKESKLDISYRVPQSSVRLIPKSLIYYYKGVPLSSTYNMNMISKRIVEIYPTIVDFRGFVLTEKLEDGVIYYYKGENVLFGKEEEVKVYKLYFYKGALMKDKAACIEAHERCIKDPEDLVDLSVYPINTAFFGIYYTSEMYYFNENITGIIPLFGSFSMRFNNLLLTKEIMINIETATHYWKNDLTQLEKASSKKLLLV